MRHLAADRSNSFEQISSNEVEALEARAVGDVAVVHAPARGRRLSAT
jgi:hypothetical protein